MTDLDHGADLRERFDRAVAGLSAPDHLTAAVLTDGHRLRRRRRVLTVATGTAAAAVVTALVAASLSGGTATTGTDVATEPPSAPAPTPTPAPSGGVPSAGTGSGLGDVYEPPPGWWDAPGHLLAAQLQVALPDGVSVASSEEDAGSILATLDAPAGPGGFQLLLYPPDPERGEVPEGPVTYTDGAGNEHTAVFATGPANRSRVQCGPQARYADSCREVLGDDGEPVGRLVTFLQDGAITFYEATWLGPDGGLVYLSVWNATDEKPGPDTPTSAEVPPVTPDQLRDLAQDPVWTSYQP